MTSRKASSILRARGAWIVALVLCAHGAVAAAQAAVVRPPADAPGAWFDLPLPGGAAGLLTAAGLDPSRPRTTAFLDVIRVIHEVRLGVIPALDQRRAAVSSYLEAVEQFLLARAALPPGPIQASAAASGNTRKSLEALAVAMGASLERRNRAYALVLAGGKPEEQRRSWLKTAGLDLGRIVEDFNVGAPARFDLRSDEVPFPVPVAAWRMLSGMSGRLLARAILLDQRASWLYLGLCGMDEETRRYLGASPQLLGRIRDSDRAAVIAVHGGSLRVHEGRIDPAGGTRAAALWEAVAGERVSETDKFILAVLGKDDGRLAHLYDAVDRMEPANQAFALGWWIADPALRLERFKALYAACTAGLRAWDPAARPFTRTLFDPAHVLLATPLLPDGRPGALGWVTFWQKAFDGERLPDRPAEDLVDVEKSGPLDAAALLHAVSALSNRTRRELCEAWCFGQRVFARAGKESLPDVLVAIRGYSRYPVVVLTLERLGISAPSVYALATARAEQISRIGDHDRAALALSLHQGALALVERARLARTLDAATAANLVASLSRLPLSMDGEFLGAVAGWIDTDYLPAIGGRAALDADAQVIGALAGRRQGAPRPEHTVEYEGVRYRVDPSSAELERIAAIREEQGGASLQSALAFAREVRTLSAGVPSLEQLPARTAGLKSTGAPLLQAHDADASGWSRGAADLPETLTDATRALDGIRKPQDLRKVDRTAVALVRAADWQLARVLVSLAYAASIGNPESTALVAGDPSALHDWGIDLPDENRRARTEWEVPREAHDPGGRWHVEGALLALDVGLGREALHRLSSDAPPAAPTISDNHRRALTEGAVLANAFDYTDADMALLAEAIARGRAALAAAGPDSSRLAEAAAKGGLDDVRRGLLSWAAVHEPERAAAFFSLGDLLRLGRLDRDAVRALDAWGTSGVPYDGRLCLRFPVSQPYAAFSGRWVAGVMPTLVPDIALLVAEALYQRHLPAVLTRSMLLVTTPDYMDRLALAHEDDWLTLAGDVQRILPPRMDDYLASVTTGGPLVPVRKASGGDHD